NGAEAGAAVDSRAVVVAGAQVGLAGVERDPDAQPPQPPQRWGGKGGRPGLGEECPLERAGGLDGIRGAGEDAKETVTFAAVLEKEAVMALHSVGGERIMAGEGARHD